MSGRLKILVIGGYGTFGGNLVKLLKDDARLKIIVAGRSIARAKTFCIMESRAELVAAEFERNGDVKAQIGWLQPDLVIDASGPFQAYGDDPYKVVRAAFANNADYVDLADSLAFVTGIDSFDDAARASGRFALSGLSTCPALTAAVARALARDLARVDRIAAGIAPSVWSGLGSSVIKGVLAYAGKPVEIMRGGRPAVAAGLHDSRDYTITLPGRTPLFPRRISLVEVPDLKVLRDGWPDAGEVWFGVGTEPVFLHKLLNAASGLVKRGILPGIGFAAPLVHLIVNAVRLGEHRSGMFVRLYGRDAAGRICRRRWHLVAEGNDGPAIPAMAAAAVIRRMVAGTAPSPGARVAHSELELQDFEALFAGREISTMLLKDYPEDRNRPIYRRVLEHAYDRLAEPLRDLHDVVATRRFAGRANVDRGTNLLARLIAMLMGFPKTGRDIATAVELSLDARGEKWIRQFGGKRFKSTQEFGKARYAGLITERFGPMAFGLAASEVHGQLHLTLRRWDICGLAMPMALAPQIEACEHDAGGRFNFSVRISMRLVGMIVFYRGWLLPEDQA